MFDKFEFEMPACGVFNAMFKPSTNVTRAGKMSQSAHGVIMS